MGVQGKRPRAKGMREVGALGLGLALCCRMCRMCRFSSFYSWRYKFQALLLRTMSTVQQR